MENIEQQTTFVFNPEPIDTKPQLIVDGVDLVKFVTDKKLVRIRKGVYELLDRKGMQRINGALSKLRDKVDEFAKVTDDDIEKALGILGGNKQEKAYDDKDFESIKQFIESHDVISIASENKYYIWEDAIEHHFDFSGLRKKLRSLRTANGNSILDDILEENKKVFNARDFSANENNLPKSIYNTVSLIYNGLLRFDLESKGNCDPILDCLFDTVSGMCPISKDVLEKSYVMMYMTTVNKKIQNRPPFFVLFGAGGTGKTRLLSTFSSIVFGRKVCTVVGASAANSDFNGFMLGKRVVGFNEMKGANKEKVTEDAKTYTDDLMPLHEKGKEARDVENVAMVYLCCNGYDGAIIAEGDNSLIDRRYQFIEGKANYTFKEEALRRGFLPILKHDIKTPQGQAELEGKSADILSAALCPERVAVHMQYLIHKHYDSLVESNWRVSSIKTHAYDVYLKRQAPAWVTKFIDWVRKEITVGKHCKPADLYDKYITSWADERIKMKPETFYEKIKMQLVGHPDLKEIYKFTDTQKTIRYGDTVKKVNGLYITPFGATKDEQQTVSVFDDENIPAIDNQNYIDGLDKIKTERIGSNFKM